MSLRRKVRLDIGLLLGVVTFLLSTLFLLCLLAPRHVNSGPQVSSRVKLQPRALSRTMGTSGYMPTSWVCAQYTE